MKRKIMVYYYKRKFVYFFFYLISLYKLAKLKTRIGGVYLVIRGVQQRTEIHIGVAWLSKRHIDKFKRLSCNDLAFFFIFTWLKLCCKKVMMGEVYIVKKEIIENPLFYFIDFASFSRNNFLMIKKVVISFFYFKLS